MKIFNLNYFRNSSRIKIGTILLFVSLVSSSQIKAQSPGPDCGTAVNMGTIPQCVTSITVNDFIPEADPSCMTAGNYFVNDGWYSFINPSVQNVTISGSTNDGGSDFVIELFGDCSGTLIACENSVQMDGNQTESMVITGLAAGTYYVRLSSYDAFSFSDIGLDAFCITTTPANDNCSTPISLTPEIPAGDCSLSPVTYTTQGATAQVIIPETCVGNADASNDDVWFTFVSSATVSSHTITITPTNGMDVVFEVFSSNPCGGAGTSINCTNSTGSGGIETTTLTGLILSHTYWIRVYDAATYLTAFTNFNICIQTPPANDFCSGAVNLTPNNTCITTQGDVNLATPSGIATCGSGNPSDDVWYKFTASFSSHIVQVAGLAGFKPNFEVFSGTCPNPLSSIYCTSNNATGTISYTLTGLTVAAVYYVRVYDWNLLPPSSTNSRFNICVTNAPPANDDCAGAIALSPITSTCVVNSNQKTGDVTGATQTLAGCSGNANDDVWYKFPAVGALSTPYVITVIGNGTFNPVFEVYSACGTAIAGTCTNATGAGGTETLTLTTLAPQAFYWIRVYDAGAGFPSNTTFTICVTTPTPPANDDCVGSIALTPLTINCVANSNQRTGDTYGSTQTVAGCAGNANDDVWYTFTTNATASQPYLITATGNGTFDPIFQVFSACSGTAMAGTCVNATGAGGTETLTLTTGIELTASTTYWIRVYDAGAGYPTTTTFTICVTIPLIPPANDNCAGAIALTPLTSTCVANSNQRTGDVSGATQTLAGCSGNANDDVWYTFTTTATANQPYLISATGNGTFDPVIQVFSACFGTAIAGSCINATGTGGTESVTLTTGIALTVSTQYWIRVYDAGAGYPSTTTFTVCVTIPTPPPSNDDCSGATGLTPSYTCVTTSGTVAGATSSGVAATCGGTPTDDVWYLFWPNTTTATITIVGSSGFNPVIEVFSSSCGGSSISCTNANGVGGGEIAALSSLTVGAPYYVRVYDFSGAPTTYTFTICITAPAVVAADCFTAYSICTNFTFHIVTNSGGGSVADIPPVGGGGNTCMFQQEQNPTWFLINISASGNLEFTLGYGTQASFYDWEMWPYNGNCGAIPLNGVAPIRCNYNATTTGGTGIVSTVPVGGNAGNYSTPALAVTAGQQYLVSFQNWSGVTANVPLVFGGTASISCIAPLPIELISFTGEKLKDGTNLLKWKTASETNNDYFILKRSINAVDWEPIATVQGGGNSSTELSYEILDGTPPNGINYYRLSQVDYNNNKMDFNIIGIDNSDGPAGKIIKVVNTLGAEVTSDYQGLRMIYYSNGKVIKKIGK